MIRFSDVSFTYDGQTRALDGITLDIAEGSFTCILGGNGSGKSTLARHMNALLVPDDGRVKTAGMPTSDAACTLDIRKAAGMVFQNPDDQLVASLVEDDVAFGPENLGIATGELARRVENALREVGLAGFEKHSTSELSGGQKQRVAIAGVLAMEPKVLILDEASAMLDPRGRAGLRRVCRTLNERGMTIVMITHFMEETADADRVVVLERGRVVLDGAPGEVLLRQDVLERLNLETPFAATCSRALAARGIDVAPCVDEDVLFAQVMRCWREAGGKSAAIEQEDPAPAAIRTPAGRTEQEPLITFDDVSFTYDIDAARKQRKMQKRLRGKKPEQAQRPDWGATPDAVWALRNVSFSVSRGEFFGIAGHTGSGKSTLVQHMNGLISPTAGRVVVDGVDVASKEGAARARSQIGMVFQYPEHQLFAETVKDDVAFGPRNLGLSEEEVEARVRRALERVGLDHDLVAHKSPFELSGGQQRRVAFAGVLAMEPEALVLDEPAAGLDPAARKSFLGLIKNLHRDGITVVMVSHSMDDLAQLCDRMAVLDNGAVVCVDTPQNVFLQAERMHEIGLGVPAAQNLANKLRREGMPLDARTLYSTETLSCAASRAIQNARASQDEPRKEDAR